METAQRDLKRKKSRKNEMLEIPKRRKGKIDFWLLFAVIGLTCIGLYMVMSTTSYSNLVRNASPFATFKGQVIYAAIGLAIMAGFIFIDDYVWLKSNALIIEIAAIVMLIAVLVFGSSINGAGRWIKIGSHSIQPAEFAKYMTIIALAALLHNFPNNLNNAKTKRDKTRSWVLFFMQVATFAVPTFLIFAQKALSMALVLAIASFCMLVCSGLSWGRILMSFAAGGLGAAVAIIFEPFRLTRVELFYDWKFGINAMEDTENVLYQSKQAMYAFARGGIGGTTLVDSRQKYGFLPMAESDFVFSVIGEEWGFFLGVLPIIALYALLIVRGIRIACRARCRFGAFLALGITLIITIQVVINLAVASATIPVTGQALPLISQGGSSLISHLAALGILLNISKETT